TAAIVSKLASRNTASAEVNVRPVLSVPLDSGPSSPRSGPTPSTMDVSALNPNPNDPGLIDPAVGVLVTVTSVPTPYKAFSPLPCAFLTPAAAAVTVITR